jgi:NAD-dependent dihydropyrimidine dehydrogenase PreA subunit
MIEINAALCNGCGACVEVCPTGALYLLEGKAMVDQKLCRDSESCITACPTKAINLVTPKEAVEEPVRVPVPRPEVQVMQVKTKPAPAPLRTSLLPLVGGALAWGWREIVPRLAEYLLHDLDRRVTRRRTLAVRGSARDNGSSARGGGRGRRWRRRRRGG